MKKRTKEAIRQALYKGSSDELKDLLFQEWEEAPQAVDIMTWIALFEFRAGKIVSFKRYASLVLRGVDEKWTRQDATLENTYERVPALYVLEGLMEANLMYGNFEEAYTLAMQLIGEGRTSDAVIRTSILSRYHMEGLKRALVVADVFIEQLQQGGLDNIEESVYLAKATVLFREAQRVLSEENQGPSPFLPEETEDIEAFGTQATSENEDSLQGQEEALAREEDMDTLYQAQTYFLNALDALGEFKGEPGKESLQLRESILDEMEKTCQNLPQELLNQTEGKEDLVPSVEQEAAVEEGQASEELAPRLEEDPAGEGEREGRESPEPEQKELTLEDAQTELLRRCVKLLRENGRLKKPEEANELYIQVPLELDDEEERLPQQTDDEGNEHSFPRLEEVIEEAEKEPLPELEEVIEVAGESGQEEEKGAQTEPLKEPDKKSMESPQPEPVDNPPEAGEEKMETEPQAEEEEPQEISLEQKLDFIQDFAKIILEGKEPEQEKTYGGTYAAFYLELRPYLANPLQLRAAFIKLLMQDCPSLLYAEGGLVTADEFLGAWQEVFSQVKEEARGAFLDTSLSRVFDNWVAEWSAAKVKDSAEKTSWKKVQIYMQEALKGSR